MSLNHYQKRQKDKARIQKHLSKDPNLLGKTLAIVFSSNPNLVANIKHFEFLRRLEGHLDQVMISKLVGEGYLRPTKDGKSKTYILTEKGSKLASIKKTKEIKNDK